MTAAERGEAPAALAWRAWPFRRHPGRGAFALVVCAGAVALAASASNGPLLPFVAFLFLGSTLLPFFVPTDYELSADGIRVTRLGLTTRRPWAAFRRVAADEESCLLSPFPRRHWLDATRGSTLALEGNRREVTAYAESMVGIARGADAESGVRT